MSLSSTQNLFHFIKVIFVDTFQFFGIFNQQFTSFLNSVNVTAGTKEERMMLTGLHTVCDIFCVGCGSNLGWKYVKSSSILFLLDLVLRLRRLLSNPMLHFRYLLMKRTSSTRKESLFSKGTANIIYFSWVNLFEKRLHICHFKFTNLPF